MKSSQSEDEIFSRWLKVSFNTFSYNLPQADFIACAYRLRYLASFVVYARRIANFIHVVDFIRKADFIAELCSARPSS